MSGQRLNSITTRFKKTNNDKVGDWLTILAVALSIFVSSVMVLPQMNMGFVVLEQSCKANSYSFTHGCDVFANMWSTSIALATLVGVCALLPAIAKLLTGWHSHLTTGLPFRDNNDAKSGFKLCVIAAAMFSLVGIMCIAAFVYHVGMPTNANPATTKTRNDIPFYNDSDNQHIGQLATELTAPDGSTCFTIGAASAAKLTGTCPALHSS